MENQKSTSKPHVEFGLFYGLALIALFTIIYTLNVDLVENPVIGTINNTLSFLIFPIAFIYFGANKFKKNNQDFISLGETLKIGVGIAFIASLIFAIFSSLFNIFDPAYAEEILKMTERVTIKQKPSITAEQLEAQMSLIRKFNSPIFSIPMTLLMFSFLGLIYSLIIGLIIKKERPQFN